MGPLLFIVYINDIESNLLSVLFKFADDTKVLGSVSSEDEINIIRHDLSLLEKWSEDWQMPFNTQKCKVLHVGHSNFRADYTLNGLNLATSDMEKDLGIYVTSDLKPGTQCSQAAKKANCALGAIKRTIASRKKDVILPLYKTLVRPHLDYCSPAWRPHLKKDLEVLEKVQRRATKLMGECSGLEYPARLKECRLTTLETRFLRADLIEVFKILKGLENLNTDQFFELNPRTSRGHTYKLYKEHARLDIRKFNFSNRVINSWNSLPLNVVEADSVNTFKGRLDLFLSQ